MDLNKSYPNRHAPESMLDDDADLYQVYEELEKRTNLFDNNNNPFSSFNESYFFNLGSDSAFDIPPIRDPPPFSFLDSFRPEAAPRRENNDRLRMRRRMGDIGPPPRRVEEVMNNPGRTNLMRLIANPNRRRGFRYNIDPSFE